MVFGKEQTILTEMEQAENECTPVASVMIKSDPETIDNQLHANLEVKLEPKENFDDISQPESHDANSYNHENEVIFCNICGETFAIKEDLRLHISNDHKIDVEHQVSVETASVSETPYVCNVCGKSFSSKPNLRLHVSTIHKNPKAFQCDYCEKAFSQKGNLKNHMKARHHDIDRFINNYQCALCGNTFDFKHKFRSHDCPVPYFNKDEHLICLKSDKPQIPHDEQSGEHVLLVDDSESQDNIVEDNYENFDENVADNELATEYEDYEGVDEDGCPILNVETNIEEDPLNVDQKLPVEPLHWMLEPNPEQKIDTEDNGKIYPCEHCDKIYKDKCQLRIHTRKIHEQEKNHKCDICGEAFFYLWKLKKHVRKIHEGIEDDFSCHICGKVYNNQFAVQRHVSSAHDKTLVPCNQCEKSFTDPHYLKLHIASVHEGQKNHKCHLCESAFVQASQLKTHIKNVHLKVRSTPCDICQKVFARPSDLKAHIKIVHEKIKEHVCQICHKAFGNIWNLEKHNATVHEKIRNWKCLTCYKDFSCSSSLKKHIQRVHEALKNIRCGMCDKLFSVQADLTHHIKIVHKKVKNHKCEYCEKTFGQTSNKYTHIKKYHPDKWVERNPNTSDALHPMLSLTTE